MVMKVSRKCKILSYKLSITFHVSRHLYNITNLYFHKDPINLLFYKTKNKLLHKKQTEILILN